MKHLLFLFILLYFPLKGFSCDCAPAYFERGFCKTARAAQGQPMFCIVKARVLSYYEYGINVEILDNIYKKARKDTVIVWGDMGACCRPTFAGYAKIYPGDTLVMALEQTDLMGNWIAPGLPDYEDTLDYVLQGCGAYYMRIKNGKVIGGYEDNTSFDTLDYEVFRSSILECMQTTGISVTEGNADQNEVRMFPNPATNLVDIHTNVPVQHLQLINNVGQIVLQQPVNAKSLQLDLGSCTSGVYTLLLYDVNGQCLPAQKLVRR